MAPRILMTVVRPAQRAGLFVCRGVLRDGLLPHGPGRKKAVLEGYSRKRRKRVLDGMIHKRVFVMFTACEERQRR